MLLNLYIIFLRNVNDIFLNNEGNKYKIKGYNKPKQKLIKESLINTNCAFL